MGPCCRFIVRSVALLSSPLSPASTSLSLLLSPLLFFCSSSPRPFHQSLLHPPRDTLLPSSDFLIFFHRQSCPPRPTPVPPPPPPTPPPPPHFPTPPPPPPPPPPPHPTPPPPPPPVSLPDSESTESFGLPDQSRLSFFHSRGILRRVDSPFLLDSWKDIRSLLVICGLSFVLRSFLGSDFLLFTLRNSLASSVFSQFTLANGEAGVKAALFSRSHSYPSPS